MRIYYPLGTLMSLHTGVLFGVMEGEFTGLTQSSFGV